MAPFAPMKIRTLPMALRKEARPKRTLAALLVGFAL
jgi:hypothetical protein